MKTTAKAFSRALAELTRVPSQIAAKVAERIGEDIQKNFDEGQDAYRRAWAPLRPATLAKGRFPPPLTDSRDGRDSIRVFASGRAGVQMVCSVGYMGIHQAGDLPRMVARKFFPNGVLPAAWRTIWKEELVKATKARLSRG